MFGSLALPAQLLLATAAVLDFCCSVRAAPADVPSAASFFVHNLPGLREERPHSLHIYSGHVSSDPGAASAAPTTITAHLFFVLIKARRTADKERVLFWFNGGPGCSSFDGLMLETGPFRPDGKGGVKLIEGGWDEYTSVVFVDQPAGTGYSYTGTNNYVHELTEAADHVVEFMSNFYKIFPEFLYMETFLAGESYAGQYIPYIADAILNSRLQTNLAGIAIGNGWFDGRSQYPAYLDYGVKHGLLEENTAAWKESKEQIDNCMLQYDKVAATGHEPISLNMCEGILSTVAQNRRRLVDGKAVCMNVYDIRLDDSQPSCGMNWPFELPEVTKYLGRSDVKTAFHALDKSESWVECAGRVQQQLYNHKSGPSVNLIPKLLEKIKVLLFAGDQDFICNYMGIESMIQKLTWNGAQGLGTVETKSWSVETMPAGTWVESRNLTYVKIFNSSHMVPYDLPHVGHDMILRFMGMNFSAVLDGSARIHSKVGDDEKILFAEVPKETDAPIPVPPGKTPEQDKAMWEAYYNAGSAALVLVLIALAIGTFLFCRSKRRVLKLPIGSEEESIPLSLSQDLHDETNGNGHNGDYRPFKGKGRLQDETIFEVGEEEEGAEDDRNKHS